ncbi:MAG: hypothetical protein J1E64_00595 [Acetatifactor sp.]|nr:hypothetical protein [Acetatifactor sp.]
MAKTNYNIRCSNIRKAIIVLLALLLCVIFSFWILSYTSIVEVGNRNKSYNWKLYSGCWVQQPIELNNTSKVAVDVVSCFDYTRSSDGKIVLSIIQEDRVVEREYAISEFSNDSYVRIVLNDSKLLKMNGGAYVRVTAIGLGENDYINILVTDQPGSQVAINDGAILEKSTFSIQYCSFSKIKWVSVSAVVFLFLLLLKYITVPVLVDIVQSKKYGKIYLIIILSLIITFLLVSINHEILINGGSNEYTLKNNDVVEQNIELKNTNEISLRYRVYDCAASEDSLTVSICQGDSIVEKTIKLAEVENKEESWIHLDISELKDGNASIRVEGKDIDDDTKVSVYFVTNLSSLKPYMPNLFVNEEETVGMHLYLIYDTFDIIFLLKILIFSIVICIFLYSISAWILKNFSVNPAFFLGIILVVVCVTRNSTINTRISAWASVLWFLSYKYGFIGKALPGTVISLICKVFKGNYYLSTGELRCLLLWMLGLLIFAELFWVYSMQKDFNKESETIRYRAVQALLILFVASPVFGTYYTQFASFGRADVLLIILFIASCLCITYEKKMWLIPVFSSLAILCHPLFVFTELPVLLMLMLYEWLCKKKAAFSAPFLFTLISSGLVAVYTQYFSHMKYDYEYVWSDIQSRTDAELSSLLVYGENYISTGEFSDIYHTNFIDLHIIFTWGTTILTYFPIICIFYIIWRNAVKKNESKINKAIMVILAICPIVEMYSFSASVLDQGRYIVLSMTAAFLGLFVLIRKRDESILMAIEDTYSWAEKRIGASWPLYICIYLAYTGFMTEMGVTEITNGLLWFANLVLRAAGK